MVGTVVALGSAVTNLSLGQRVASPFTANCGACFYCSAGATCRCQHAQARLFGWIDESEVQEAEGARNGLHGSQAQYVRVPLADATLLPVPDDVPDELAILLGDILSTAYFCAENGGVSAESAVAVVGCGPVGLLAIMAAQMQGAKKVWAVDAVPERLALAAQLGAQPLHLATGSPLETIRSETEGRGADVVLEVVGSSAALRLAFDAVRPCGTISSVGVHTEASFPFSPVEGYNKNVTYRSGRCPARRYMARLMPLVAAAAGAPDFTRIITHRMPLSKGVEAYDLFANRRDGCIKVVLDPWS